MRFGAVGKQDWSNAIRPTITAINPNRDKAFEIEVEEEKEVDQLEVEVNELAEKVIELRRTVKLVFRDKMESLLLAMRPKLPKDKPSSSVEESKVTQGTRTTLVSAKEEQEVDHETAAQIALLKKESKVTQGTGMTLVSAREEQEVDQETATQITFLKIKIAANVIGMPATTERMKLCIEKIDRLEQYKVNIDFIFTKKMNSDI